MGVRRWLISAVISSRNRWSLVPYFARRRFQEKREAGVQLSDFRISLRWRIAFSYLDRLIAYDSSS